MTLTYLALPLLFISCLLIIIVILYSLFEFITHKLKEERTLVKILRDYELSNGKVGKRKDFEELLKGKDIFFKQNINELINDCVCFKYIHDGQNDKDKVDIFKVTESGGELLNFSGFLEEILKRRRRLTLLLGATIAILVTIIVSSDAEIRFGSHWVNSSHKNEIERNFHSEKDWNLR